jgi:hypothetical protein
MKLQYWILACAASAGAAFAGCSYERGEAALQPQGAGFFFSEDGGSAKLAYGVADSDDVGLMMECAEGSQTVRVSDLVRSSPAPVLILASSGRSSELKPVVEAGEGGSIFTVSAPTAAPALAGFRYSGKIEVAYAGLNYRLAARPSERPTIDRFFAACDGQKA